MAVRHLAPALLALAEIVHQVNIDTTPEGPSVTLDIRAFDKASFDVVLTVAQGAATLFASDPITALNNLIGVTAGTIDLISKVRGRRIDEREQVSAGATILRFSDGTTLEAPSEHVQQIERTLIRKLARDFVDPLRAEGIETTRITFRDRTLAEVSADDLPAFEEVPRPIERVTLGSDSVELTLTVGMVDFQEDNQWRLSEGGRSDWYVIEDEDFLTAVDHREPFRKGDTLRALVRFDQSQTGKGAVRTKRVITRVIDHGTQSEQELF
jgi:hypothetical protein